MKVNKCYNVLSIKILMFMLVHSTPHDKMQHSVYSNACTKNNIVMICMHRQLKH